MVPQPNELTQRLQVRHGQVEPAGDRVVRFVGQSEVLVRVNLDLVVREVLQTDARRLLIEGGKRPRDLEHDRPFRCDGFRVLT